MIIIAGVHVRELEETVVSPSVFYALKTKKHSLYTCMRHNVCQVNTIPLMQ